VLVDDLPAAAARHEQVGRAAAAGDGDQPATAGEPELAGQHAFGAQAQQPTTIRPSSTRAAAPTRSPEYGQ
jgi:hypothetical protein